MAPENDTYTPKEEKFCYEYCIDLNATQAAIRAGYSPKTARSISSTLLTKVNIQKKIKEKQDKLAETAGVTALKVVIEHKKIAFSNAGNLRTGWMDPVEFDKLTDEEKSCIQEVSTTPGKFGDSLKVKMYDKQKSLDSLSNILGFNSPIKNELTGKGGKDLFQEKYDPSLLDDTELNVICYLLNKAYGKEYWGKWLFTFQEGVSDGRPSNGNPQEWGK